MAEKHESAEIEPSKGRDLLLEAVLEVFPLTRTETYEERYSLYQKLLAGREEEPLSALHGIFSARWALAVRRWRKLLDENLRREGQSLVRWQVLFEISVKGASHTLTSLAARVGILSAALVGVLDELEAEGLVLRTVDDKDRRSKILTLTSAGEETVSFLYDFTAELRAEFLQGISRAEIELMLQAVDRMNMNLDRMHFLR